jgi:molybdopterin/thiamine biosynthesis adenylyltransferase/rhodanese-related sulfurtransferase
VSEAVYCERMLTAPELARYARQLVLREIGLPGQERLRRSKVLIVGAGGLGSPAALYLAAAGIGLIGLLDDDAVELSNLHRQILHRERDVGRRKAESGADSIRALNEHVEVRIHAARLTDENARDLLGAYDLIVDGSDNYPARYAVNDACAVLNKPWVYGSVERFAGQVSVFGFANGPCYRCLFPEPPAPGSTPSCEQIGVLGAVPGVIGSLQAVEALKCLLGIGEPLAGRLVQIDFLSGTSQLVSFERRDDCLACGTTTGVTVAGRRHEENGNASLSADVEPVVVAERLRRGEELVLLDIREPWEASLARIGDSQLLPMNELPTALATLDPDQELVLYCHHGVRSSMASEWLRVQGFRARSLAGGIDRWSREVDPSVPRY